MFGKTFNNDTIFFTPNLNHIAHIYHSLKIFLTISNPLSVNSCVDFSIQMGEANIFENITMTLTVKVSNEALYKTVEQAQFDLTLCKDKDTPLTAFAEASINVIRVGETNRFSGRATFR